MPEFTAARNLIYQKESKKNIWVKAGDKFECDKEYHDAHLAPHGHTVESSSHSDAPKVEAKVPKSKKG